MNRRTFIESMGILGAASLLPISCLHMQPTTNYKLGYQLFSIRDEMTKDPIGTLKLLKKLGYQDFEIYGFDAEKGMYYGYTAADFKMILDDLGLTVSSGHYGFSGFLNAPEDILIRFVDQCIQGADTLNSAYITWPWIAPEQRTLDNFKIMSKKLNIIGEQVKAAGLGFAYHNHGYEFDDHNGQNGYDIILSETDAALVKLQMDMYWVMHSSKYTPKELIQKQPGRYVMWHIKDMDTKTRDYTELGNGSIDYTTLLPDPIASGLEYYYIEQGGNFAQNSIQSATDSATYFKEHLQKYL
ncbi:sugar phosphate isomerase [Dokdonia pacifica]|uniref:Sugar phosphate isomerase/epimerase n=1 Tax=Dokdonia pacifica TaxID=1627892 RepID=A0A239AYP3_9FLAO|nr:sugar phosphate isomerase/epimerase [Dokdonia pacifica]GGG32444.1 sugar phosphate isomerase [Dokdonia pacifica]SNS00619.1 Sugar phosphate isomerase/epimerase [Dokdonia pacifica]